MILIVFVENRVRSTRTTKSLPYNNNTDKLFYNIDVIFKTITSNNLNNYFLKTYELLNLICK